MGKEDEGILKQFEELKKLNREAEFKYKKKWMRKGQNKRIGQVRSGIDYLPTTPEERRRAHGLNPWAEFGYINEYLKEGVRTGDLDAASEAIIFYLNRKKAIPSVRRKVLKVFQKYISNNPSTPVPSRYLNVLNLFMSDSSGIESKVLPVIAIAGLGAGIFFLSPVISGNVIGQNSTNFGWLGGVLFLVGLVGAFFWAKKR